LRRRVGGSIDARISQVKLGKGTGRGRESGTSQHVQPLVGQEGGAQTNSHSSSSSGSGRSTVTLLPSTLTTSPTRNVPAGITSISALTSRPYNCSTRTPS